jgi:hypothetical protein
MRSRYDHGPNQPDAWPGENWLADWWRALTGSGRWLAGAGLAVAVVLALGGVAAAGGFSDDGPGQDAARDRPVPAAVSSAAVAPASAQSVARHRGAPRTSCPSVAHIGDSTSADLISPASVPAAAQRLRSQYLKAGVRHVRIDASGGRSIVEEMPGQLNGYKVASSWWASGYRGCWVFALGTNDAANVAAGSGIGLATRIDQMMSTAHGEPVLWVNTRTELAGGPYSEASETAWDAALNQALARYPNMRIFNWAAVAQPGWFLADGIHYSTPGCTIRAHDIARALDRAFPGRGPSASRVVT